MKCKECIFYTGVKCHGHNDYWGNCILINELYNRYNNMIIKRNNELENDLRILKCSNNIISNSKMYLVNYICYDNDNCKYNKFIIDIYTRGIINEKEYNLFSSKYFFDKCNEMYNFKKWLNNYLNSKK